jgi:hypothetical protein
MSTSIAGLAKLVRSLPARPVQGEERFGCRRRCQREHWLAHLRDYPREHDAKFCFNHIQCPAMLVWLAGSVGVHRQLIERAINTGMRYRNRASQCAAIRRHVPWTMIEPSLTKL